MGKGAGTSFSVPCRAINEMWCREINGSVFQNWVKNWKSKEVQKSVIVIFKECLKILYKIYYKQYVT